MTTSTCSANGTGLPDRRLFLSTIAAASLLTGSAALAVSHCSVDWIETRLAEKLAAPPARLSEDRRGLLALSAMIDAAKLGAASSSERRAA